MNKNHCFLVLGMAGTGKTTLCHRLYNTITSFNFKQDTITGLNQNIFSVNLDPAVLNPKMPLNEDIRDFFDVESVMKEYDLGPNGAVNTALNLFLLKVDSLFEKMKNHSFVIIDTPGQIETFVWSSSGLVLIEALKALENTEVHILYLIDTTFSENQEVFIANMLYAASISCRYGVQTKCLFNKIDASENMDKLKLWMTDYIAFRKSLDDNQMYTPLLGSLALYLEEFYNNLPSFFVSGENGDGINEFLENVTRK